MKEELIMTLTEKNQYDIDRNQERMIMALGKLQQAKDLIDEADMNNPLEELMGTLPVISGDIDNQIVEIKKVLGIELTSFQTEIRSISSAPEEPDDEKVIAEKRNGDDYLDFHNVVDRLYQAIEDDNLELVEGHLEYISDLSRTYANPRNESHDHLDLFSSVQALYKAINDVSSKKVADVIDEIEDKSAKGMLQARKDREFNEEWNKQHK